MERTTYRGWRDCVRVSNSLVDLVTLCEAGPRIIRFGFVGEENEFREFPDLLQRGDSRSWHVYGGHRLWHAPEHLVRTYVADNAPVAVRDFGGFFRTIQGVEKSTGIRKEMDISMSPRSASVKVVHRLVNENQWDVELAPWAPTLLEQWGKAFVPFPPRGVHPVDCLPTMTVALWPYTDMADARFQWGSRYAVVRQDPMTARPQKIGISDTVGWCAYLRHGHLFVKLFAVAPGARYPDLGSNVTVFINDQSLELETMAPLSLLRAGQSVEYTEHWCLFKDVPEPGNDDEIDAIVASRAEEARKAWSDV
ncbi:MAG: hypothetical protein ABSG17_23590 [Spirochaetia bacterium]